MKRPVTPENRPETYKDRTICKTTKPVVVRIKDPRLPNRPFGIDFNNPQELPAGSEVIVFDAQTVNLTGINESLSPANTAYRIEGKLQLTAYDGVSSKLDETNCSNEKVRKHSNLIPVVPLSHDLNKELPRGTIVALKESTTYNGMVLPQGELFAVMSHAKTPRGQNWGSKKPIRNALYDVVHVKKNVREFEVRNPSNLLVMHKDLESVPQENF